MAIGSTPRGTDNIPQSSALVPNTITPVVIQGSPITTTDGNGNTSTPVVFHHSASTVYLFASAAITTGATHGPFNVGPFAELALDINITARSGTSPTIQFFIDRIGADNVAYNIYASAAISATGQTSTSIGSGFVINQSFGSSMQIRWVTGGTTPSFTTSVSIVGK